MPERLQEPPDYRQLIPLLLIFSLIPLQYLLTSRSTESNRQYHLVSVLTGLSDFRHNYLNWAAFHRWCSSVVGISLLDSIDPVPPDAVKDAVDKEGHFAGSFEPRHPRPPHIKYRVGQVIKHTSHGYRGVIIGWDETAVAPESWLQQMHPKSKPQWRDLPNYAVLVDTRDRFAPQMTYVVEEKIEVIANHQVYHPLLEHHFEGFDGAQYLLRPWLRKVYPHD